MTTPSGGAISFGQIASELGLANSNVSFSCFYRDKWGLSNINMSPMIGSHQIPWGGCINLGTLRGKTHRFKLYGWGCSNGGQSGACFIQGCRKPYYDTNIVVPELVSWGAGSTWIRFSQGTGATAFAIRSDGTLWGWGANTCGYLGNGIGPGTYSSPVQISASSWCKVTNGNPAAGYVTHAIRSDGTLWGWGCNGAGTIGDGTTISRSAPVQIAGTYSTGKWAVDNTSSSYAIRSDGTLWGWGINSATAFAFGTGYTSVTRSAPVQVTATSTCFVCARAGGRIVITPGGGTYVWGCLFYGMGNGLTTRVCAPYTSQISGAYREWVMSSQPNGFGIRTDGTLWGFGCGPCLGVLNCTIHRSAVTQINTANHCCIVPVGSAMAFRTDGTMWCYCSTGHTQLGVGMGTYWEQVYGGAYPNYQLRGTNNCIYTKAIAGGCLWYQNLAYWEGQAVSGTATNVINPGQGALICANCSYFARGQDTSGYFGSNQNAIFTFSNPIQIGSTGQYKVATNENHGTNVALIRPDGTLWGWGFNCCKMWGDPYVGQINYSSPVQVWSSMAGCCWVMVSTEYGQVAAINNKNELWVNGANFNGELGQNDLIARSVPVQIPGSWRYIQVGGSGMYGIKTDDSLWVWGVGSYPSNSTLITVSSPVQIAGSWLYTHRTKFTGTNYGIKSDCTLWVWGYESCGNHGQNLPMGIGSFRSSPVQIAGTWTAFAGGQMPMGIKSDGTLWAWGCMMWRTDCNYTYGISQPFVFSSPVQVGTGYGAFALGISCVESPFNWGFTAV